MVAPERRGWVSVYPDQHGQDVRFGAALAEAVSAYALQLVLHDGSLVALWLWNGSTLLASFMSRANYFGVEEEPAVGGADSFNELLPGVSEKLRPLLSEQGAGSRDAGKLFERIAKHLGIPDAGTAYEYLKEGNEEQIRGVKKFVDLPHGELSARTQKRAEAARARKEAARAGLLLADLAFNRLPPFEYWCVHNRFLVSGFTSKAKYRVLACAPPWKKPTEVQVDPMESGKPLFDTNVARLVCESRTGRVYDVDEGFVTIQEPPARIELGPNRTLVRLAPYEYPEVAPLVVPVRDSLLHEHETPVVHPSGEYVVARHSRGELVLIGARQEARERRELRLHIYPERESSPTTQSIRAELPEWERISKIDIETTLGRFAESLGALTPEARAGALKKQRGILVAAKEQADRLLPLLQRSARGHEQHPLDVTASFTLNGEYLCTASERGLCVYEWEAVVRAREMLPEPRYYFDTSGYQENGLDTGFLYAVTDAGDSRSLLFGGLRGVLYRLDLTSGRVFRVAGLTDFESHYWINKIIVTGDRSAIAVHRSPPFQEEGQGSFQIWAYEALLKTEVPIDGMKG